MANLVATINWQDKTVTFSGSGTFHAKDKIKSLGAAKWQPNTKTWQLPLDNCPESQLNNEFPGITIAHEAKDGAETVPISSDQLAINKPNSDGITVARLIGRIRSALVDAFPKTVTVRGVLSKINHSERAGHYYIDLSDPHDPKVTINAIIWKGDAQRILGELKEAGFLLEADLEVMVEASVDLNPNRASISLVIKRFVVEFLIGKLEAERDKTNKRLQKEKLFERNKSLSLPLLPQRLGLITSSGGTVINDFLASLDVSDFGFELFWYKANVQGQGAAKDIIKGLATLQKIKRLDAILIFRGGGSKAELSVFNDYELAKAVCLSSIPVVSAIGHQEDQSSLQDVSFQALGVPKDIGRLFADIINDVRQRFHDSVEEIIDESDTQIAALDTELDSVNELISERVETTLRHCSEIMTSLQTRIPLYARGIMRRIEERTGDIVRPLPSLGQSLVRSAVSDLKFSVKGLSSSARYLLRSKLESLRIAESIQREVRGVLIQRETALDGLGKLIEAARPEHQLDLGYALIKTKEQGAYVTKSEQLDLEDEIEITFSDGTREASISK